MAYEEFVVIGFGVVLAVLSVSIFGAHVRRINAPNKGDPGGSRVAIHLAAAIAQDEAARRTKMAKGKDIPRRSTPKGKSAVLAVGKPGLCTGEASGNLSGEPRCGLDSAGRLQAGSIQAEASADQQVRATQWPHSYLFDIFWSSFNMVPDELLVREIIAQH